MNAFNNLKSRSVLSTAEIFRNIADIVGGDGSRAHGLLETLSSIQCNTAFPGIIPDSAIFSGAAAVSNKRAIFCPGGSKITILDIFASGDGVCEISFSDQDGNSSFPSVFINNANGHSVSFNSVKGIFLSKNKSFYYTVSASINWVLSVSYKIIAID